MKIRRVIFWVCVLFLGLCSWAQSGSPDYKQQALKLADDDFFSHVTVVNDNVYFFKGSWGQWDSGYWGKYLDQFQEIKLAYSEDVLSKADKLNGVNWRGKVFIIADVGRIYYAENRNSASDTSREALVYNWSDWINYADKPIVEYQIESRNTQWVINTTFHRRQSSWWPDEKWEGIVRIPSDQIPDDTKNVDLVKLYNSLADSASPAKSASSSSVNDSSGQIPIENSTVKPGFRLKILGKSVVGGE